MQAVKEIRTTKEKRHFMYRGIKIKIRADFSLETMETRIQWSDIFKVLKQNLSD